MSPVIPEITNVGKRSDELVRDRIPGIQGESRTCTHNYLYLRTAPVLRVPPPWASRLGRKYKAPTRTVHRASIMPARPRGVLISLRCNRLSRQGFARG